MAKHYNGKHYNGKTLKWKSIIIGKNIRMEKHYNGKNNIMEKHLQWKNITKGRGSTTHRDRRVPKIAFGGNDQYCFKHCVGRRRGSTTHRARRGPEIAVAWNPQYWFKHRLSNWLGEGFNNNYNYNYSTSCVAARGKILVRPSFSVCTLRDAEKKTHKHKVLWEKR